MTDLSSRVNAAYSNPLVRDALNAIAASEGGEYNIRFGGAPVTDLSRHPNQLASYIDRNGRRIHSSAAGRYQFLNSTYQEAAQALGLKDFSPESQDKAAIYLLYKTGALGDVENGDIATALGKINNTWTSLPGSRTGLQHHAVRTPEFFFGAYNASRKARGEQPVEVMWNGQSYSNVGVPAGETAKTVWQTPRSRIGGLAGRIFDRYASNAYGQHGPVQFRVGMGDHLATDANAELDEETRRDLIEKLHEGETGYGGKYGMSFVGGALRPTIRQTDPDGNDVDLIEFPDDIYINSATGVRHNRDGSVYVEPEAEAEAPTGMDVGGVAAGTPVIPRTDATTPRTPIQQQVSAQDYLAASLSPTGTDDPLKVSMYNDPMGQLIADYLRRL